MTRARQNSELSQGIDVGSGVLTQTLFVPSDNLVNVSGTITANTGVFDLVEFNSSAELVPTEGQLTWDTTYGTLDIGFSDTYALHVGQETNFRVRNETGVTLYKGQAVAATGVHSDNIRLEIDKYTADGNTREIRFIGLLSEDIGDNGSGYTTNFGYIRGNATYALDTRGNVESPIAVGDETWAQGDILYVHPTVAGKLTKVEPQHSISVAIVIRVHQTDGVILVRPTSYGHLTDLHDVDTSGVSNGQTLVYNSGTLTWEAGTISGGIANVVEDTTPQLGGNLDLNNNNITGNGQINVDNLRLDGNTLSSTDTNGSILLVPNGYGGVIGGASSTFSGYFPFIGGGSVNKACADGASVVAGILNLANGAYSIVGGGYNNCSTAITAGVFTGWQNKACGSYSFVGGGWANTSSGQYSTIGGGGGPAVGNTACGWSSVIGGGQSNTASGGFSSISGGKSNTASGNNSSVSGGCSNVTNARHSTINGGHRNVIQSPTNECCSRGVTIGGGVGHNSSGGTLNATTGDLTGTITCCNAGVFSTISGGLRNCATGNCSTVGGGSYNTASANYSTVGGGYSNIATNDGLLGGSTVSGGIQNYACGYFTTVSGGYFNTASGCSSTVGGGGSNSASASYSTVGGGRINCATQGYATVGGGCSNTASGFYSIVSGGYYAKSAKYGELSHAAGRFSATGDAQHSTLVARKNTTDATANQVLFLDGSSARLTIPAETTWMFSIKLAAHNDTNNDGAWWTFRGGIRRDASNNTSLIGSIISEYERDTNMATATASVVADDTNEALEIRVTGVAAKNIRWVAVVDISQVSWGTP